MYRMDPHDHRCCQHNAGHAWPYYAQHLWYATADNGLAAALYGPCTVTAKVGTASTDPVTLRVRTRYPFEETIRIDWVKGSGRFPIYFRVPGWCTGAQVRVDGRRVAQGEAGRYLRLEDTWRPGRSIELTLPMRVTLRTWTKNGSCVSVDRGPLTYSLKIKEKYVRSGGTDPWPAWDIFPESAWNYALEPGLRPDRHFKVVRRPWPSDDQPFEAQATPIQLRGKGRRVPAWTLDERGLVREVQASPVRTTEPLEDIVLIPMGAARLRIAAFPVTGRGSDAHEWVVPTPSPLTASHCFESDTPAAAADQQVPKSSNDGSIPRMTWWPNRGTTEWLQWTFEQPRSVGRTEVYWFDDTGVGQCRLPASWRVLHRRQGQWVPVSNPGAYGAAPDRFNSVRFDPVTTDALRLEVTLKDGYSGGVLEWRVE
jgi:hypothetical protein